MKAQSALEYLLTYGWLILIILIVVAVLYNMGVFSPNVSSSLYVTGLSNFQISDAIISESGNLSIELGTKTGLTTTVSDIDYSIREYSCLNTDDDSDTTMLASEKKLIIINPSTICSLSKGEIINMDINITYTTGRSSLEHKDRGLVTIMVQ